MSDDVTKLAEVLAEHRFRDLLGDYEIKPYYKHFGCSCGWERNIAGMSGYWSWLAAHEAHVAEQIAASDWLRERDATNRLAGAVRANTDAIAAYDDLEKRLEALAAKWEAVATVTSTVDWNRGYDMRRDMDIAALRALIAPEATP